IPDGHSVYQHIPFFKFVEPHKNIDDGTLTASSMTYQRNGLSRFNSKTNVFEHRMFTVIGERNILELNFSILYFSMAIRKLLRRILFCVQYPKNASAGNQPVLKQAQTIHHTA